jgi:hypothetical protein
VDLTGFAGTYFDAKRLSECAVSAALLDNSKAALTRRTPKDCYAIIKDKENTIFCSIKLSPRDKEKNTPSYLVNPPANNRVCPCIFYINVLEKLFSFWKVLYRQGAIWHDAV